MAKDKSASKAAKPAPKAALGKPLESVKAGRVTKPIESMKNTAKEVAKKVEKTAKKGKKESSSEASDESEEDITSESSASSDDESESESEEKIAPKANGIGEPAAAQEDSEDESGSDDSSDASDSEDEAAPKVNGAAKAEPEVNGESAAASNSEDDSEGSNDSSEASDSEEDAKAGADIKMKDESESDDSEDDEEDEEDEAPKAKMGGDAKADADDSSAASSSSEEESEEEEKPKIEDKFNKKRKADEPIDQTPKKTKITVNGEQKEAGPNLFIGRLSWNVDDEWLMREFEEFGQMRGARVITDRGTGRSKGYGYVEYVDTASAIAALEAKHDTDIDGRTIRVDFSLPRPQRSDGPTPQQRGSDRAQKYGDVRSEPSSTLFVGNVVFGADEDMFREAFQDFGYVKAVRLPTDRETGDLKGYGYIEMSSLEEAKAALEGMHGVEVGGRPIRLDYATSRPQNDSPRGGFGGSRGRGGGFSRGGRGGGDRGRGGRGGGRGGSSFNRGGFGDFSGKKTTF